jgi:adenylate cyclase
VDTSGVNEEGRPAAVAALPAPDLAGEDARYRALCRVAYNVVWEPHLLLLVVFAVVGRPWLALLNAFSVIVLLSARALDARGKERAAFWMAIGEITVHAVVATAVLGLAAGSQFQLLFVTLVSVYVPFLPLWGRVTLSVAAGAVLLGLIVVVGIVGPVDPVSAHLSLAFLLLNVAILIGGMAAVLVQLSTVVRRAEDALAHAYVQSESLLLNVLPASIVERLKRRPGLVADRYPDATILFADIVDFTPMSARLTPDRLVMLLDDVNKEFDELIEAFGLEKIKTIGDAYMVAGGVPTPRDDHAEAVAELALAMQLAIGHFHDDEERPLKLRIGMASGPVVAGVIGHRKFSYDLWGDTVNTAARMESHGIPGAIHVAPETFEHLKERFAFTPRGPVEIKGKGLMQTYLLDGRSR